MGLILLIVAPIALALVLVPLSLLLGFIVQEDWVFLPAAFFFADTSPLPYVIGIWLIAVVIYAVALLVMHVVRQRRSS